MYPQEPRKIYLLFIGKIDLVDTFQFMSTSLEKLVKNLAEEGLHKFRHLRSYVNKNHGEYEDIKLELLSRKSVYPYRYMDSFDRFQEDNLPSRSAFYNDLEEVDISEEDYAHAQRV